MKSFLPHLLAVILVVTAAAQSPPAKPSSRAAIEGIVTKDPGGEPVKKALIELIAENQSEGGDYTATTGPDGQFRIENILPGRYHLFAERTGLLELDHHRARSEGRILTLTTGQELKSLQIRLQAAAVVRGRVTDEDGDPLPNAQVAVLRQTFSSGRSRWEQAGSERSNDLGEYRIAGLPAGNYYLSVTPPPDFKTLIEAAGAAPPVSQKEGLPAAPASNPPTSYQTTYYPGTTDRSQAAPIQLHAGDDFPANFSLAPSPSLTIRGSVENLPPRASAVIMLQSRDFNLVLNGAEIHKDGSFIIRDVSPGAYTILATVENSPLPMMARQSLLVSGNSVEGLRLAPQPGASVRGSLRLESKANISHIDLSQLFLTLLPTDGDDDVPSVFNAGEGFSRLAHVAPDGTFAWKNVPPGNYYVQLAGDGPGGEAALAGSSADWFLKSVLVGNREADDSGISVNGGGITLELLASANGAAVDGVVTDRKGEAVPNATVVLVPEARLRALPNHYHKTVADQSGHFTLHGLPPGDYSLFAWESIDGDPYYNPEFLKTYEPQATALQLKEGDRKTTQLQSIPDPEVEQ
jgi:hypothetical protein